MKVAGSVALVTGGAQGIGKAICHALLRKGAKVCVADWSDLGRETVKEFTQQYGQKSAIFVKCDVRSLDDVKNSFEETVESFGHIDIVANNAAIVDEEDYEMTVDINLTGVMRVLQTAMRHMDISKGGNGGVVINTASIAGLGVYKESPVYSTTKHAVVAYTRCYGTTWHYDRNRVRVNCLCPGPVDTRLLKFENIKVLMSEERFEELKGQKFLRPEEVADGFIDLVVDESKNGVAMVINPEQNAYIHEFPE